MYERGSAGGLGEVRVVARALLPCAPVPLAQLAGLEPGALLELHLLGGPALLWVNGRAIAAGRMVTVGSGDRGEPRRAFQLGDPLGEMR